MCKKLCSFKLYFRGTITYSIRSAFRFKTLLRGISRCRQKNKPSSSRKKLTENGSTSSTDNSIRSLLNSSLTVKSISKTCFFLSWSNSNGQSKRCNNWSNRWGMIWPSFLGNTNCQILDEMSLCRRWCKSTALRNSPTNKMSSNTCALTCTSGLSKVCC